MCDSVWREALGLPSVSSAVAQLLVVRPHHAPCMTRRSSSDFRLRCYSQSVGLSSVSVESCSASCVTLAERGRVFTFTRSLQVEGDKPLQLTLDLARTARPPYATAALLLLAVAGIAAIPLVRRK